jgi:predicted transposase/invertase (TIGR01784 family)
MATVSNIHDTFFRETMSHKDVAVDFLQSYLPGDVLAHLRLETLSIRKDTFVGADQAGHYSDLLYEVSLGNDTPGFIYFLFEHKSYPDRFVSLQLLRYLVEIWELYRRQHPGCPSLPMVIPVVVYHGKTPRRGTKLSGLMHPPEPALERYVPNFDMEFYDFSPRSDFGIKGQIVLQLVLSCFRAKNQPTVARHVADILQLLSQLDDSATSMHWVQTIFRYLTQTMDIDHGVVHELVKQHLSANKEDSIMTLAEQWLQEGLKKGRLEGRMEGRGAILNRLLSKRFGQDILDIRMQERLRTATPEQLDLWAERILDARTIDEVFTE